MCLDCGCMEPDNRHGDERHLIVQDLVDAAQANQKPPRKVFETVETGPSGQVEKFRMETRPIRGIDGVIR